MTRHIYQHTAWKHRLNLPHLKETVKCLDEATEHLDLASTQLVVASCHLANNVTYLSNIYDTLADLRRSVSKLHSRSRALLRACEGLSANIEKGGDATV